MTSRDALMGDSSKLDGNSNYSVWSFKMRNMLSREDVWKLVEPPVGTVAPTNPAEIAALQLVKHKALTMIALSVRDNVIPYISSITEPAECWKALKDLYANSTNSRKLLLRRKLTNLKMQEGSSMSEFLQHLKELLNEFACIGQAVTDAEVVEHVLMALPESYEGLVNTLMYRPALPTVAELTVVLMQDDIRRELKSSKRVEDEALLIRSGNKKPATGNRRSSPGGESAQPKSKKNGECHYCGSKEHWMRNCPQLAAEIKSRKARRMEKPSINLTDAVVDNFMSSEDEEVSEGESGLAVSFTELNLASDHEDKRNHDWFIDSGASKHVTGLRNLLSELEEGSHSKINTAGGQSLNVEGKGTVEVPTSSGSIKFDNVLYVPGVTKNLLSVGSITDGKERLKVLFDSKQFWILKDSPVPASHNIVTTGRRDRRNGLYRFRPPSLSINSIETHTLKDQLTMLWHNRLGHANFKVIAFMSSHAKVHGLPPLLSTSAFCTACRSGKQCREPKPRRAPIQTGQSKEGEHHRTISPLELLHTDICGPLSVNSLRGSRYILTITDDFSRFTWLFFLKHKSETLSKFRQFKATQELQSNHRIKIIRSDRGGEYISQDFINFCNDSGIVRQLTQAHTPHQNGIAERKNRSLLEKARSMAFASNTPSYLWTEAVATANYLINRTATRANHGTTPFEKLTGRIPSVSHLRVFGCRSYVLDTSPSRKKWAPRSYECIFLGYDETSRGFRNYNRSTRKILVSKDVQFDEAHFPSSSPILKDNGIKEVPQAAEWPITEEIRTPDAGHTHAGSSVQVPNPCAARCPEAVSHSPSTTSPIDRSRNKLQHRSSLELPKPALENDSEGSHDEAGQHSPTAAEVPIEDFSVDVPLRPDTNHHAQLPLHTYQRRQAASSTPTTLDHTGTSSTNTLLPTTRSGRIRRIPSRLDDFHLHFTENAPQTSLPLSIEAALLHPGWKRAMDDELASIYKNGTWDIVSLPHDRQAITTKWIYRVKTNADGSTAKLKARLVAKGFQQKPGQDYTETFAPVVKWNTLRSIVALAGHHGWNIFHLDVKTAFLNGVIEEDIYVRPPPGFDSSVKPNHACKLKKALYGLKQAPRAWYTKVDTYLLSQGLQKSKADYNLYFHKAQGKLTLLLLYVDDVYLTGNNDEHIAFIKSEIQQAFEMSDLGLLSYSLGMEFLFRSDGLSVTQRQYIREMLTEFGLEKCKPAPTPMMEKLKLLPDMKAPLADSTKYQRMVGKLIFLTHTRIDIAFAVSIVSRFMNCPQEPHAQAVKRIYRYLQGTSDLALLYRRGEENQLRGFTDADWAADMHDRKSTTGYVFFLGGTPITWNSRKQPTVALSSTESEYMAVTEGAKEAVWLRRLLGEIHVLDLQAPTTIHGDNQGSLNLAQNPIYHGRTKHIEVRHHFIREKISSGEINLDYVPTNEQLADILTKPLGKTAFERLREQLGLIRLEAPITQYNS